jgi:hypothetical protein
VTLITPFRSHYEHCRALDIERQLHECADHLQHPDVLLMEFFDSYHQIERGFRPEHGLAHEAADDDELVLEPFYESLELSIEGAVDGPETLTCVSGSMSPIPEDRHPALSRRGLDYVGVRGGSPPHVVLGVVQAEKEETPYVMLLRALNCFAELSPPLRVVQLGNELIRDSLPEDVRFDLHIGITEPDDTSEGSALVELTRDLAELFKRQVGREAQFSETLGRITCVFTATGGPSGVTMKRIWSV